MFYLGVSRLKGASRERFAAYRRAVSKPSSKSKINWEIELS